MLRLPEHGLDVFRVCQHDEVGGGVSGMFYAGLTTRFYLLLRCVVEALLMKRVERIVGECDVCTERGWAAAGLS